MIYFIIHCYHSGEKKKYKLHPICRAQILKTSARLDIDKRSSSYEPPLSKIAKLLTLNWASTAVCCMHVVQDSSLCRSWAQSTEYTQNAYGLPRRLPSRADCWTASEIIAVDSWTCVTAVTGTVHSRSRRSLSQTWNLPGRPKFRSYRWTWGQLG